MITHKVLMFGGRGSGKSSVLAAIYQQASTLTAGEGLRISTDHETARPLFEKTGFLRAAFNKTGKSVVIDGESDYKVTEYPIILGRRSSTGEAEAQVEVRFIDTAGEWFLTLDKQLTGLLSECRAAILAVDAVELMQGNDIPPKRVRNSPDHAHHLVQQWVASNPSQKKLLVVVPIKTETYIRQRPGHDQALGGLQLLTALRTQYRDTFAELAQYSDQVAVVIAPAQTVGNLVFSDYQDPMVAGDYPVELWEKIEAAPGDNRPRVGYAPYDCDQSLRHILNFVLVQAIQAKRSGPSPTWLENLFGLAGTFGLEKEFKQLVDWVRDEFGSDSHFVAAVKQFASGCKREPPFSVVQGESLLTWQR